MYCVRIKKIVILEKIVAAVVVVDPGLFGAADGRDVLDVVEEGLTQAPQLVPHLLLHCGESDCVCVCVQAR